MFIIKKTNISYNTPQERDSKLHLYNTIQIVINRILYDGMEDIKVHWRTYKNVLYKTTPKNNGA
jgi:hypothetical protein